MFFLNSLSTLVLLLIFGHPRAEARVAAQQPAQIVKTNAHDISLYTKQYFLDHALYDLLPCNSCLFYTYSLTATAQRFAMGNKMELITIWDIWPSGLYNADVQDTRNPLRNIFSSAKDTRKYYENMSSAMVLLCGGYATVMTKDISSIPLDGIWGTSEFPTLKRGGRHGESIHTVLAVDAKGENSKTVWEHPKDDLENCRSKRSLISRQGVKRYKPEQLQEWFAAVAF
jgi:hypothetical protein